MHRDDSRLTTLNMSLLALGICIGLSILGYLLSAAIIQYREFERTVTVKGLSVREYPADVVIWPIQFSVADNDLGAVYGALDKSTQLIRDFLISNGIVGDSISVSVPAIVDKSAQQYGGGTPAPFRYSATQTVTVYSNAIDNVRKVKGQLSQLGKQGIVFSATNYEAQTEFLFLGLNDVKPGMIEEATQNARMVANKFADDSNSRLGKIKQASQGQFSISPRDKNNPHIKQVRVVSTVQYYLVD